MPNPEIKHMPTGPVVRESNPGNGWLLFVDASSNVGGCKTLQPPDADVKSPQTVDMDVPGLGRVRITYEAKRYSVHKSTYWSWRATWADKIDAQGDVIAPA